MNLFIEYLQIILEMDIHVLTAISRIYLQFPISAKHRIRIPNIGNASCDDAEKCAKIQI